MNEKLFISDLHLDTTRPKATQAFFDFLEDQAKGADALYILGDLFEISVGPDPDDLLQKEVGEALFAYIQNGGRCWLTHGNRDFMLGIDFTKATGVVIQPAIQTIDLFGERALLMHGDELCTDDEGYQRMRRYLRMPFLQAVFRVLPLAIRRRIGQQIRSQSLTAVDSKPMEILDVNPMAVYQTMRANQSRLLIHGHTHRPAIHDFELDGQAAKRIVLGDWYEQGSVLSWTENGPELKTWSYA